jgi:hypothetical protein
VRKLVYDLLFSSEEFMDLVPGGLYGDRALDIVPSLRPFAVLVHEGPMPVAGSSNRLSQTRTSLWVHDEVGDYTRIDEALRIARSLVTQAVPHWHEGVWLMEVEWRGDSPDLFDDVRGTNTKNTAWLLTGSGL